MRHHLIWERWSRLYIYSYLAIQLSDSDWNICRVLHTSSPMYAIYRSCCTTRTSSYSLSIFLTDSRARADDDGLTSFRREKEEKMFLSRSHRINVFFFAICFAHSASLFLLEVYMSSYIERQSIGWEQYCSSIGANTAYSYCLIAEKNRPVCELWM